MDLIDVTSASKKIDSQKSIIKCMFTISKFISRPINRRVNIVINEYIRKHTDCRGLALDAGVGYGASAGELAKLGFTVHGVDIDPFAFMASTVYIGYLLQKPYLVFHGDLNQVELPKWFYDVITCTETLEHILEDDKVIKKLHDALRHDGIGIFAVPLGDFFDPHPHRKIEFLGENYELYGHIREYKEEEFLKKLEQAGFRIIERTVVKGDGGDDPKEYEILIVCAIKDDY